MQTGTKDSGEVIKVSKLTIQLFEIKDKLQRKFGEDAAISFKETLDEEKLRKTVSKMPIPDKLEGDAFAVYTNLSYKKHKKLKGGLVMGAENYYENVGTQGLIQLIFTNAILHQVNTTIAHLEGDEK